MSADLTSPYSLYRRFKQVLGYEEQAIENTFEAWRKLTHPDDLPELLDQVQRYPAGNDLRDACLATSGGIRYLCCMKRSVAVTFTLVLITLLVACGRDPSEVEKTERTRIVTSYERLLRERETEWVRTVGRGMATVLALRVALGAHDTARTAVALIMDDVLARGDGDGIKALAVLLETDAAGSGGPEPYVATWVENGHVERELGSEVPARITVGMLSEELVFDVAGTDDDRRITVRLYYSVDQLEALLADKRRRNLQW